MIPSKTAMSALVVILLSLPWHSVQVAINAAHAVGARTVSMRIVFGPNGPQPPDSLRVPRPAAPPAQPVRTQHQ